MAKAQNDNTQFKLSFMYAYDSWDLRLGFIQFGSFVLLPRQNLFEAISGIWQTDNIVWRQNEYWTQHS